MPNTKTTFCSGRHTNAEASPPAQWGWSPGQRLVSCRRPPSCSVQWFSAFPLSFKNFGSKAGHSGKPYIEHRIS